MLSILEVFCLEVQVVDPRLLGLYWDNGKENGNYYRILGLY